MKTIAQQLNIKEFPFTIKDSNSREIYYEDSRGFWFKREFDSNGNRIYFENSVGGITDARPNPVEEVNTPPASEKIIDVLQSLSDLLQEKNRRYGNSALEPLGIFNKGNSTDGILIRIDDKLQRIKNSSELRKNDVADIMGYLTLLCVSKGWDDFKDLID